MVDAVKALAGIGVVVVALAIAIGGWQLGWWMKTSATNRTAVTYQHNSVAQLQNVISQIDQVHSQLVDVNMSQSERAMLTQQQSAMVEEACGISARITSPLPSTEAAFVASNC
jgi:hypothetical protein